MKTHQITPNPNCSFCHGSGETVDYHPYGSTTATEYILCDCVTSQLPKGCEDDAIELTPVYGEPIIVYLDLWEE